MEIEQGSKGTYFLERADVRTGQDRNKAKKRGELTSWRGQVSGLVRTWKQSKVTRGTHLLERADVGTDQVLETKRSSKGNSLAGKGRRQDWSEHGNKPKQRGKLTGWRGQMSGLVRKWKGSERGELTSWRGHTSGQIRSWKQSEAAKGTHVLERADWSGHGNKARQQGKLTT